MSATIKELEDAGGGDPTTSTLNPPIRPAQKTDGLWKLIVDYCKLNQVVTPKINTSLVPGTACSY